MLSSHARVFLLFVLILASLGLVRLKAHSATVEGAGLFSYQAPSGWKLVNSRLSAYPIAMGNPVGLFAPNLNCVVQTTGVSLENYVVLSKNALATTSVFNRFKVVDETSFATSEGLKGIRLVADDQLGKLNMEQIVYFFVIKDDEKLVITGSSLRNAADHYGPIFDASVKTLRAGSPRHPKSPDAA